MGKEYHIKGRVKKGNMENRDKTCIQDISLYTYTVLITVATEVFAKASSSSFIIFHHFWSRLISSIVFIV